MDRLLYTDLNKLIFQLAGGFPKAHAQHATGEAVWPALSYYLTLSVWLFSAILGLPVLQGPNKPSLISVKISLQMVNIFPCKKGKGMHADGLHAFPLQKRSI